ncbi:hypothetical protein [Asaia bogorensis]|uniref:hypothetical protein n=1 Tax=Asaia bogorensis TaxID=91915 RepID=UPI00285A94AF|nr:hypothetical protein [Asaia bogorensis]MDR6182837.1 hypothetical protein [Asaia bogorensis NBRC 16594]
MSPRFFPHWQRLLLVGAPFCAVLLPMPFLYGASWRLLGVPVILWWLFACLPFTTLCLALALRPMGAISDDAAPVRGAER